MRLERLTRGHVLAAVAALALLLIMAMDWYGSHEADRAHQVKAAANPNGAEAGEVGRAEQEAAQEIIARDEKNAWQTKATIDRVLLALLLVAVFLPLIAATLRAAGRRFEPPWTPSAASALAAVAAALLVAYRIIQKPGPDSVTTLKIGPALALIALAVVGLGSAAAFQKEADWASMRQAARTPRDN